MHAPADASAASVEVDSYRGEVIYLFAFDVAYDTARQPLRTLLGQPVAEFVVDASKRAPRQLFFYRPQMVRLPPLERLGPHGPVRVERTVKVLPVGAISIAVRVPFEVDDLRDLVVYHELAFSNGSLHDEVLQLAGDICTELKAHLVRPHERLAEEEAYTVFCIESPLHNPAGEPISAEHWLAVHRRDVAAILTEEPDIARLSVQESEESTARHLSYYGHDLVVIDWDAALLLDEPRFFDESIYLMELANLQLAELEAYDRLLDDALDRAYRDLRVRALGNQAHVLREVRELRIDLARLSDELSNITKFFGDWHLARIYQALAARFHLADWHHSIDQKLKTLDDLYAMLAHDRTNRLMLILETTIVLLFIADIVMLFMRAH
ncbi:hypothetical protein ACXR0O_17370 [Verrucomicrobiota bacterium sgz303538]